MAAPDASMAGTWAADAARVTTLAHKNPFGADELAGMLRGLFSPQMRNECALERDDRLRVPLAFGLKREPGWR